jgi:hypothetical protein
METASSRIRKPHQRPREVPRVLAEPIMRLMKGEAINRTKETDHG